MIAREEQSTGKRFGCEDSTTAMRSIIKAPSGPQLHPRHAEVMLTDVLMVMLSVPLSLLLSNAVFSFKPLAGTSIGIWFLIGLLSHALFRYGNLYTRASRIASAHDFYFIFRNCAALSFCLYGIRLLARPFIPITGLNERQFIAFFLLAFTLVCLARLVCRYLPDRPGRAIGSADIAAAGKRVLFLGSLDEAAAIVAHVKALPDGETQMLGIIAGDRSASLGSDLEGVPVVGVRADALLTLREYAAAAEKLDLVVFGPDADKAFANFPELVRVARRSGVAVVLLPYLSRLSRNGVSVLENADIETLLRRSVVTSGRNRPVSRMDKGKPAADHAYRRGSAEYDA